MICSGRALGSRTAWLHEPQYAERPGSSAPATDGIEAHVHNSLAEVTAGFIIGDAGSAAVAAFERA